MVFDPISEWYRRNIYDATEFNPEPSPKKLLIAAAFVFSTWILGIVALLFFVLGRG